MLQLSLDRYGVDSGTYFVRAAYPVEILDAPPVPVENGKGREDAEPRSSEFGQQGIVLELSHDLRMHILSFEPALQFLPQSRVVGRKQHGSPIE